MRSLPSPPEKIVVKLLYFFHLVLGRVAYKCPRLAQNFECNGFRDQTKEHHDEEQPRAIHYRWLFKPAFLWCKENIPRAGFPTKVDDQMVHHQLASDPTLGPTVMPAIRMPLGAEK